MQYTSPLISNESIKKRKLVCGVGVNNANYRTSQTISGKRSFCPYYIAWRNMINRCYSPKSLKTHYTYRECSVCENWLTFSNFRSWMSNQDWKGKQLDKDIITQGNKVYSPDFCIFVTRDINMLTSTSEKSRGVYKLGVYYDSDNNLFVATCAIGKGKKKNLGRFLTEDLAHKAYKEFKYELIRLVAIEQSDPLKSALLAYKINEY